MGLFGMGSGPPPRSPSRDDQNAFVEFLKQPFSIVTDLSAEQAKLLKYKPWPYSRNKEPYRGMKGEPQQYSSLEDMLHSTKLEEGYDSGAFARVFSKLGLLGPSYCFKSPYIVVEEDYEREIPEKDLFSAKIKGLKMFRLDFSMLDFSAKSSMLDKVRPNPNKRTFPGPCNDEPQLMVITSMFESALWEWSWKNILEVPYPRIPVLPGGNYEARSGFVKEISSSFKDPLKKLNEAVARAVGDFPHTFADLLKGAEAKNQAMVCLNQFAGMAHAEVDGELLINFNCIVFMYVYSRIFTFRKEEDLKAQGISPSEPLVCWIRPDLKFIFEAKALLKSHGFPTDPERPEYALEAYRGEDLEASQHNPKIFFHLYPINMPPLSRTQKTFQTMLNFMRKMNDPRSTVQLSKNTIQKNNPVTPQYIYHINTKYEAQYSCPIKKNTNSNSLAGLISASLKILNFIQVCSQKLLDDPAASLKKWDGYSQEYIDAAKDLASIESLSHLLYGFIRCGPLFYEKKDLETFGFNLLFELDRPSLQPQNRNLLYKDMKRFVPGAPVRRRTEDRPAAVALRAAEVMNDINAKSMTLLLEGLIPKALVDLNSVAATDFKNYSFDEYSVRTRSYVDDYLLLREIMQEDSNVFESSGQQSPIMRYRFAAKVNEATKALTIKSIDAGEIFFLQAPTYEAAEIDLMAKIEKELDEAIQLKATKRGTELKAIFQRNQAARTKDDETFDKLAVLLKNEQVKLLQFYQDLCASNRSSQERTQKAAEYVRNRFLCPKNMTSKAVSKIILTISEKDPKPIFGLFRLKKTDELFAEVGFVDTATFMRRAEKGATVKAYKSLIADFDKEDNEYDEQMADIMHNSENTDDVQSRALALEKKKSKAFNTQVLARNEQKEETPMNPLSHSARFTYEVLFYIGQHFMKSVFPFGKTYPDSAWIYSTTHLLDPTNRYGLRMSAKEIANSVGQIQGVDRYQRSVSSILPSLTSKLSSTIHTSEIEGTTGYYLRECNKVLMRCSHLCKYLSQSKTELDSAINDYQQIVGDFSRLQEAVSKIPLLSLKHGERLSACLNLLGKIRTGSFDEHEVKRRLQEKYQLPDISEELGVDDILYYCDVSFLQFITDVSKALTIYRNNPIPKKSSDVSWLLSLMQREITMERGATVGQRRDFRRYKQMLLFGDKGPSSAKKYIFGGNQESIDFYAELRSIRAKLVNGEISIKPWHTDFPLARDGIQIIQRTTLDDQEGLSDTATRHKKLSSSGLFGESRLAKRSK